MKQGDIEFDEIGAAALGGSSLLNSLLNDGFAANRVEEILIPESKPTGLYLGNTARELAQERMLEELTGLPPKAQKSAQSLPRLRANPLWPKIVRIAAEDVQSDEPNPFCQFVVSVAAGQDQLARNVAKRLLCG